MLHKGLVVELVGNTATSAYLAGGGTGIPDRVYPQVIPQKIPRGAKQVPAVVYETRSVDRSSTYCGTIRLIATTMTLDCYALTYDEVKELALAVRELLTDFRGLLGGIVDVRDAKLQTEFDVQDFEPGLYRVSQSWVFWHVE